MPGGLEVTDVDERQTSTIELVDGALLSHRALSQQTPDAGRRVVEFLLEPAIEDAAIHPLGLSLGRDFEQRVDARLQRSLLEQVRAKAVDRTNVRLFELR